MLLRTHVALRLQGLCRDNAGSCMFQNAFADDLSVVVIISPLFLLVIVNIGVDQVHFASVLSRD